MSKVTVLLVTVFLFSPSYQQLYVPYDDDPLNLDTFCTVSEKVTIKSVKTGLYMDGGESGENLMMKPEGKAPLRYWELQAGNGFYVIKNINNSNIFDVEGGCWDGMNKQHVISYKQDKVARNNRFYYNPMDKTIGVQCVGQLRMKVDDNTVLMERIDNPKTSQDDIRFEIEYVS